MEAVSVYGQTDRCNQKQNSSRIEAELLRASPSSGFFYIMHPVVCLNQVIYKLYVYTTILVIYY
jgi:hypothetical protein